MSFGDYIESQFPGIKWNGRSHIHRSICGNFGMDQQYDSLGQAMELVHKSAMGLALWNYLQQKFGEMDWQVVAEEFRAIILVDVYRHLNGEGDTKTPQKIRNPVTGNVFHRLAIKGDIVGGVRIWHNGGLNFGFRFRLAGMDKDDHTSVPLIARKKALDSIKMAEEVVKKFNIAEPTVEEETKIRKHVTVK
ncbi:hypothetical protein DLP05_136 [Stenotrophomonas phage vB_SmaS_DLP_5]|uniref:Uncharacterized protein n=1 Tax=Stenotrophomonas phage vB_SmaS_DLP_5 TaxID=2044561 RepID=A0A2D2W2G1_9CAUD|nr:hypothetical protein FDJ07_gp085 [Stenotrophomonas phage vB_SmaS_DLP_5]ATS92327.1 hypothetical protein DLP05_136 [Stenotrophomonas phage vB_SmaS_DLP_5]